MLTPAAAKAKNFHDVVNHHPTDGIRHMFLAGTEELR